MIVITLDRLMAMDSSGTQLLTYLNSRNQVVGHEWTNERIDDPTRWISAQEIYEQATGCTNALEECTADDVDEVGEIKMSHKEIDEYLRIRNAGNAL